MQLYILEILPAFKLIWVGVLAIVAFLSGMSVRGQFKTMNAIGSSMILSPSTAVTGTSTETEVFRDTIAGGNLSAGKNYSIEAHFNVTTPFVALGTTTVRVYLGSSVVAVLSGGLLSVGSLTNAPLIMFINIVPRSMNLQMLTVDVRQPQGTILTLGTGNSNLRAAWSEDGATDKIFRITVQLGGTLPGNSFGTDWIGRAPF